jgi:nucleotidyltransferase substrate binding protein (TIGR01987 family)
MEERLSYNLNQLTSAIADFEESLRIEETGMNATVIDTLHNGQAQKFEFTIELFWKTVKVFLFEEHGFDIASPKGAVKKYFELGYVSYEECDRLIRALDIRNSLSHVYKKESFLALYDEIRGYQGFLGKALAGIGQGRK